MSVATVRLLVFLVGVVVALGWYAAPLAHLAWHVIRTDFFYLYADVVERIALQATISLGLDELPKFLIGAASGIGLAFAAPQERRTDKSRASSLGRWAGAGSLCLVGLVAILALILHFVVLEKGGVIAQEYGSETFDGLQQLTATRFKELIGIFGAISGVILGQKVNK